MVGQQAPQQRFKILRLRTERYLTFLLLDSLQISSRFTCEAWKRGKFCHPMWVVLIITSLTAGVVMALVGYFLLRPRTVPRVIISAVSSPFPDGFVFSVMTGTFIDGDDLKGSFPILQFCNTKKGCRQSLRVLNNKENLAFFESLCLFCFSFSTDAHQQ
jgi:hypothetical protein